MSKMIDMKMFADTLEQNIKLYDVVCRNLFPWIYISKAILSCLESPTTNTYLWNRFKDIYNNLDDEVKSEMNHFCKEIGFVLD